MKKQDKSSMIKNLKIKRKNDGVPFKGYVASIVIFMCRTKNNN